MSYDTQKVKNYEEIAKLKDSEQCLRDRLRNRGRSRKKTPHEQDVTSRMRLARKDALAKSVKAQEQFKDPSTIQKTLGDEDE